MVISRLFDVVNRNTGDSLVSTYRLCITRILKHYCGELVSSGEFLGNSIDTALESIVIS